MTPTVARAIHCRVNVEIRRQGGQSIVACDGPDCLVCAAILDLVHNYQPFLAEPEDRQYKINGETVNEEVFSLKLREALNSPGPRFIVTP